MSAKSIEFAEVDEVLRRFAECGHLRLRDVTVERKEERFILLGELPSFYLKQMAQFIASSVVDADRIQNEISICNQSTFRGLSVDAELDFD